MGSVPDHTAAIARPEGGLRHGRVTGRLRHDPVRLGPGRGRVRRWLYVAAGGRTDDGTTVIAGAAIVALGPVVVAFAYATLGASTVTFDARTTRTRDRTVGTDATAGARFISRGARLQLNGNGGLQAEVPTTTGTLVVDLRTTADVLPVVLVTGTPQGGWNVTEKAAGTAAHLEVALAGRRLVVPEAAGWRDYTAGRQDRRTTWRWAAGAGHATDGTRIGLNASTGMNGCAEGEDLLWVDGAPYPLPVEDLAPVAPSTPAGAWRVTGPGTGLDLAPLGERSRREVLGPVVSDYTQPIGRWRGTVTAGGTDPVEVDLVGVAEDHLAVW